MSVLLFSVLIIVDYCLCGLEHTPKAKPVKYKKPNSFSIKKLEKLATLKNGGMPTQEEFDSAKADILKPH